LLEANYFLCVKGQGLGHINFKSNSIDSNISYFSDICDDIAYCLSGELFSVLKREYAFSRELINTMDSKLQLGGSFIVDLIDKKIMDIPESKVMGKNPIRLGNPEAFATNKIEDFYKNYEKGKDVIKKNFS